MSERNSEPALLRKLRMSDAIALVVGTVVGTGIFLKTSTMALQLGSMTAVLAVWAFAGILSLFGALTYAELSSRFPEAGGEYIYLREAYGDLMAFLYGWMHFWIGAPGSIAAFAVGATTFLSSIVSLEAIPGGRIGFAIFFIAFFSALNCLTVSFGGRLQSALTLLKVLMIFALVGGVFFYCPWVEFTPNDPNPSSLTGEFGFSSLGLAMIAALWAYDGWNNLPKVAGEISNPKRNIPIALGLGMILVIGIYSVTNLAYFHALPFSQIVSAHNSQHQQAPPVATLALNSFMGEKGTILMSIAMLISALGAMNGSILTNARVPYAMAKNNLFFHALSTVGAKNHVPYISIVIQGLLACLLAATGSFDELTDQVVFALWIFYLLTSTSIFIFRRREQAGKIQKSPYRTFGYPVVPILFIGVSCYLLVNTLVSMPAQSFRGIVLIAFGVPVYHFIIKRNLT